MKIKLQDILSSGVLMMCLCGIACAQAQEEDNAAQANNPLANMTAFNVQNYYIR